MTEETQISPPCPICQTPCKFLTVRFEDVARCPECGTVLRNYKKGWMSDKQAIENLYKWVADIDLTLSLIRDELLAIRKRRHHY